MLAAFRRLRGAEARFTFDEAAHVAALRSADAHAALGFSSFGDLARELLHITPRTAERRVALHRALAGSPDLEGAFLGGRLSACQILALAPLITEESAPSWVALAGSLTVREIRALARSRAANVVAPCQPELDDCDVGRMISFDAPAPVAVAFDHAMESARRVLGWRAPRHACVMAVLAEATSGAAPVEGDVPGPTPTSETSPQAAPPRRRGEPVHLPVASHRLRAAETALREIEKLTRAATSRPATAASADPVQIVHDFLARRAGVRSLRVATGRLLRHLRDSRALDALGYVRLQDFAEEELGCSERTARALIAETSLFEDNLVMEERFATGRLGASQAHLVQRVATRSTLAAWLDRAERLTVRQLQREVRFLENLRDFDPAMAARFALPGRWHELVSALRSELGPVDSVDPAEDPRFMRHLELLLERVRLAHHEEWQTLSGHERLFRIRFWAPTPVAAHWHAALRHIRAQTGHLPDWACVALLIRSALAEWERLDPDARPSHADILERDGYLCQAPGCSRQRNLEVHHIQFRSAGGGNAPDNRITLCACHHRHVLHEGVLRLEGRAPGALRWTLKPLGWVLNGEKRLTPEFPTPDPTPR